MITPSLYTFGAMSLGQGMELKEHHIAVVRQAMDAGIWFHASPTYNSGFAFMTLRMAFDEDRSRVPKMIIKIRDGSARLMRFETEDCCRRLGLDAIDVAQLVSMDPSSTGLTAQLLQGGPIADELASLRERGLIRQAVIFTDRAHSPLALQAQASPLVDGLTFYWNACQRGCQDQVWQQVKEQDTTVLALRTLAGGFEDQASQERRTVCRQLAAELGCTDEVEFALRLAASYPAIRTTIGGTQNMDHLNRYIHCAEAAKPLPAEALAKLEAQWQDSVN